MKRRRLLPSAITKTLGAITMCRTDLLSDSRRGIATAYLCRDLLFAAIMVYIWFRFEWQFSIAAILALAHDVLTTIVLFALTSFEFNPNRGRDPDDCRLFDQ